ncbi:MAG: hypothetical protein KDD44_13530 [Bdellovibrionales bacterium]|nr:hypothetical protein [Bdellovibrionales bacterium]
MKIVFGIFVVVIFVALVLGVVVISLPTQVLQQLNQRVTARRRSEPIGREDGTES